MYINKKQIDAINDAIDFIEANTDGADEENNQSDVMNTLHEMLTVAKKERFDRLVKYYVKKKTKNNG